MLHSAVGVVVVVVVVAVVVGHGREGAEKCRPDLGEKELSKCYRKQRAC